MDNTIAAANLTLTQAVFLGVFAAILFLSVVIASELAETRRAQMFRRVRRAFEDGYNRAKNEEQQDAYNEDDFL